MLIRLTAEMNNNDGALVTWFEEIFCGLNLLFHKTSKQRCTLQSSLLLTLTF